VQVAWKKKLTVFWKAWGYSLFIGVLIATSFKSSIADWNIVPTGSMKPTIVEGDRIFINKLAYDLKVPLTTWHIAQWSNPQRGDIVVFYSPKDNMRLVKRVVGLPGDRISMREDVLYINGRPLKYDDIAHPPSIRAAGRYFLKEHLGSRNHPITIIPSYPAMRSFTSVTIPAGKYFMMGDNRDNSADSRYFGFVARDRIVGKATAIVISLNADDYYAPRWKRFFTKLQ
jgi:signal peptidase I